MRFDRDPAKDQRNRQERGFGFDFAALIFEGDTIERPDNRHDYNEARVRAIGDVRRIISARMADRKGRLLWRASR